MTKITPDHLARSAFVYIRQSTTDQVLNHHESHLGNRLPAQSENPRRLAPALPFDEYKPSNRCVRLHCKHPRPPSESMFGKGQPKKWPGFIPPRSRKMPPLRGLLLHRRVQNDRIKQNFGGNSFDLIPFPSGPWDVPDDLGDGKPKLALMSFDAVDVGANLQAVPELVAKIYERKNSDGAGLRSLRNNLVFVLADDNRLTDMKRSVVRRLALRELKRPERLNDLADHQREKVLELEKRSEIEVAIYIQQCFRHVRYPAKTGIGDGVVTLAHSVIDIQNASEKPGSGQTQVVRQLQAQNKLRDASDQPDSPSYIRDRTPLKKGQMTTHDLRDEFRRDPSLPILLSDDVFRKAIVKGVTDGVYVYQRGSLLAGMGDPIHPDRCRIHCLHKGGNQAGHPG